jgi:O-antigen/teichoic acid export membrane protein
MWSTVGIGVLSIAVFAMTIPLWGVLGAAIGAASTQVLGVCLRILHVWRLHHIQPFTQQLGKPILAALVTAMCALLAKSAIPAAFLPVLGCLIGLMYVGILLALKFDAQDRQALGILLSRVRTLVGVRA